MALVKFIVHWSAQPAVLAVLVGLSLVSFVASMIGVPWYLKRLPADYLSRPDGHEKHAAKPLWRIGLALLKNVMGAVLVLAGVAMLVLPGQGIATVLAGLFIMDFPGKKRFTRRLLALAPVLRAVNALRRRAGAPPLALLDTPPPKPDASPPHSRPSAAR